MKKTFALLAAAAALTACNNANQFTINTTVEDASWNGQNVCLLQGTDTLAKATVENNACTIKGEVDSVAVAQLKINNKVSAVVLLEKGATVNIKFEGGKISYADNKGANETWSTFNEDFMAQQAEANKTIQDMFAQKKPQSEVYAYYTTVQDKLDGMWKTMVQTNADNLAGAMVFSENVRAMNDAESFFTIYNSLRYAGLFKQITDKKEFFDNAAKTAEGKMFVDFEGKDLDGNVSKLSDYVGKGKYVLVDFWASWCGPCRGEIPNLINVHKDFAGDQFTVLGVNVWDKEGEFKKALEAEKVNYPQIYASDNQKTTDLYGINGIPQIILFGPDGTILKRNLRGEAIPVTIAEYVKK